MEKINELEDLISTLSDSIHALTSKHESFEDLEDEIESNLTIGTLSKDLSFAIATLYLAQQKLSGNLKANDPVLKVIKKVQERDKRISAIEKSLQEESGKQSLAEKVFEKHVVGPAPANNELLRKRNDPRAANQPNGDF